MSPHAGIPRLKYIMDQIGDWVHFWPFDGFNVAPEKSAAAKVYTSIFRNRYPRDERSGDEHNAYAITMWLKQMDGRTALERYFNPPLSPAEYGGPGSRRQHLWDY